MERNIGQYIALTKAINPTNASAGTINGASVDRSGYLSAVLHVACGAASGTPTAQTVDAKIQESADGSSWSDVSGAAITQITADNSEQELNLNLSGRKQYIRAVVTVAFTGGTSPAIPVAATLALGGAVSKPV